MPAACRTESEEKVRGVQAIESGVSEQDRSPAVGGQIDPDTARHRRRGHIAVAVRQVESGEVDSVVAIGEVRDGIGTVCDIEDEEISACAAPESVVADPTFERVVAASPPESIVSGIPEQPVVSRVSEQRVIVFLAFERVVACGSDKLVVAGAPKEPVVPAPTNDSVVAFLAPYLV